MGPPQPTPQPTRSPSPPTASATASSAESTVSASSVAGVAVVADATRPPSVVEFGIDLVLHSATKYLGGHNDLLAGAVLGSEELVDGIRSLQHVTGAIIDPLAAYLLVRGF